jgi:hypothetical protein
VDAPLITQKVLGRAFSKFRSDGEPGEDTCIGGSEVVSHDPQTPPRAWVKPDQCQRMVQLLPLKECILGLAALMCFPPSEFWFLDSFPACKT